MALRAKHTAPATIAAIPITTKKVVVVALISLPFLSPSFSLRLLPEEDPATSLGLGLSSGVDPEYSGGIGDDGAKVGAVGAGDVVGVRSDAHTPRKQISVQHSRSSVHVPSFSAQKTAVIAGSL